MKRTIIEEINNKLYFKNKNTKNNKLIKSCISKEVKSSIKKLKNNYNKYIYKKINYFMINIIFSFICFSLSKQNSKLREINFIEEIIITINGPGQKAILSSGFNSPPDEIIANGEKSPFNPNQITHQFIAFLCQKKCTQFAPIK